jgi:hypothetical protein
MLEDENQVSDGQMTKFDSHALGIESRSGGHGKEVGSEGKEQPLIDLAACAGCLPFSSILGSCCCCSLIQVVHSAMSTPLSFAKSCTCGRRQKEGRNRPTSGSVSVRHGINVVTSISFESSCKGSMMAAFQCGSFRQVPSQVGDAGQMSLDEGESLPQ